MAIGGRERFLGGRRGLVRVPLVVAGGRAGTGALCGTGGKGGFRLGLRSFPAERAGCLPPHHGTHGHHRSRGHRRAGASGSARTATMSHRGGPDRINVTSLRFGSAGCWCWCDGAGAGSGGEVFRVGVEVHPGRHVGGRVRHREAPGIGPHGGGQPGPGEPQLIGGDIEPDGAVAASCRRGPERPVPQATSRQIAPPPGPRHSRSQASSSSWWNAEKVSSYHCEWPSYRAIPGLTRIRLARRSTTAKASAARRVSRSWLPGSDQVVRSVTGIDGGAVEATARDRDQRDRIAGELRALSHEDRFVVPVEGRAVMPLDRAGEDQGGRDR